MLALRAQPLLSLLPLVARMASPLFCKCLREGLRLDMHFYILTLQTAVLLFKFSAELWQGITGIDRLKLPCSSYPRTSTSACRSPPIILAAVGHQTLLTNCRVTRHFTIRGEVVASRITQITPEHFVSGGCS